MANGDSGSSGHGGGGGGGSSGPGNNQVSIHIDNKEVKSPSPTTGAALYLLGQVKAGYELFRETKGKGDDEAIANDQTPITLHGGDKFYTAQATLNPGAAGAS